MPNHEILRLLQEALWHQTWTLIFLIACLAEESAVFVSIFRRDVRAVLILWCLTAATLIFSRYLRAKGQRLRQQAKAAE